MAFLPLSGDHVAIVDDEDLEYLKQWKWFISRSSQKLTAVRKQRLSAGIWYVRRLHHEVLGLKVPLPKGKVVDHINHDTLDCRKGNLRVCSIAENVCNRRPWRKNMTSKYKGINWHKKNKRWGAAIQFHGVKQWLGSFESEYDAVQTYNAAAIELHGPFACINLWDGPTCWSGDPADAPPGNPIATDDPLGADRRRPTHIIPKPPGIQLLFDFM